MIAWSTSNDAGFDFDTCGENRRRPVDFDGLRLVAFHPSQNGVNLLVAMHLGYRCQIEKSFVIGFVWIRGRGGACNGRWQTRSLNFAVLSMYWEKSVFPVRGGSPYLDGGGVFPCGGSPTIVEMPKRSRPRVVPVRGVHRRRATGVVPC